MIIYTQIAVVVFVTCFLALLWKAQDDIAYSPTYGRSLRAFKYLLVCFIYAAALATAWPVFLFCGLIYIFLRAITAIFGSLY